jgi:hypothetical protein
MTDWAEWSREAVRMMQARNDDWSVRFGLTQGRPYRWDLDSATIVFQRDADEVVATLTCVGTASASCGSFLWAWADPSIPAAAQAGLAEVREFGAQNDLPLLTEPAMRGGKAEGLEACAVAGRITRAGGMYIDAADDFTFFFLLREFRTVQRN